MAAKRTEKGETEGFNPFDLPPESRLVMRSVPFFQLRGYENLPDTSRAKPKVDSRNLSYKKPRPQRAVLLSTKVDYRHVQSKIDTGRRREGSVNDKARSVSIADPLKLSLSFSSSSSFSASSLCQLQKSATLPSVDYTHKARQGGRDRWKAGATQINVSKFRKEAKARVDCSDPTPEVHKQSHTLQELEIFPLSERETVNPRFASRVIYPENRKRTLCHSITGGSVELEEREKRSLQRSKSAPGLRRFSAPIIRGKRAKMEELRQPALSEEAGDEEIVKLKQLPAATRDVLTCTRVTGTDVVGEKTHTEPVFSSTDDCSDGIQRQGEDAESENRDSVSSSEGIGVNPEYCSIDVITDAFAAADLSDAAYNGSGEEPQRTRQKNSTDLDLEWGAGEHDDKIVGLEVSASGTETTVNLLHLLQHKNRSAEETSTEYTNHELWVIGEEGGEESEDEDDFSEGESESESTSVSVPQLFIVDENDAVVERVRTGRRRSSTKDCSASGNNSTQLNSSSLTSSACSVTSRFST